MLTQKIHKASKIYTRSLSMASYFQDDSRESQMIELFGLIKDKNEGRSGIDAFLEIHNKMVPFELKTTSKGSITTVRDFGPNHIKKWKDKHWLFGFFHKGREIYKYGSPSMMQDWIETKGKYIQSDFQLAEILPEKLTLLDLHKISGEKEIYSFLDAKVIQKNQYSKKKYLELMDLEGGYSPDRMLKILKARAKYIIERGSTLNNPHIPENYFSDWEEISVNHAQALRKLVSMYLQSQDGD
jgi:hypothetical protein